MRLFHPIRFMLATPAADFADIARTMPDEFFVEDKFDGIRAQAHTGDGRVARGARTLGRGVSEALRLLRTGNPAIVLGSLGYWAFDNVVLWASFHAFGVHPALTVVLMGYLIGQLWTIALPVLLAIVLATVLWPPAAWLRRPDNRA